MFGYVKKEELEAFVKMAVQASQAEVFIELNKVCNLVLASIEKTEAQILRLEKMYKAKDAPAKSKPAKKSA